jgi:hypothetical protein
MAKLEKDGEYAEQLFVHGLGVQTAEGLAEWLHWRVRNDLGIDVRQGRRYSWGYPAVPDQSEHLKVEKLLELEQIGMQISDGYAPIPEQSTLAIVAHHPQATYYGMRNGRLLVDGGVFAINPAVFAYAEAGAAPELLLSLGTGSHTRPLPYDEVKNWGRLEWAEPIIDVVFDGSADAVDLQLTALDRDGYIRLQTELVEASDALDDASAENLAKLRREAVRLIALNDAELGRACALGSAGGCPTSSRPACGCCSSASTRGCARPRSATTSRGPATASTPRCTPRGSRRACSIPARTRRCPSTASGSRTSPPAPAATPPS